jgi:hypothetical protein
MKFPEDFDDKEELRDYVIAIILKTSLTSSIKKTHPKVYTFLRSLFQRHPDKERKEVSLITDISIRKFPTRLINNNPRARDYQIFIIKNNGTEDSISWNSCVDMSKPPVETSIYYDMRYSIKEQIMEFKFTNKNKPCELCGTYLNITADHIIKFKKLKDNFLLNNPEYPKEFGKSKYGSEIFREEDIEFEKTWQEYHMKNATLRILCTNCNDKLDDYPITKYNIRKERRFKVLQSLNI